MTPSAAIALAIVALIVFGTIAFALSAVRRVRMDPHEFVVGSRSFGALLLWILLAGEIYTSFTFLGAAGWAYGKGAVAYYILIYGCIGYTIGYFYLPHIWRIGKERGLMTWPDYLRARYDSKILETGVGVLQFFLVVPYVTLQLTGLQILLGIAGYGTFNATVAVCVAFALISIFVFTAGLRGAAWASVVKDVLVLGAALFAGIYLPVHFFGSPAGMFSHVLAAKPHWLAVAPGTTLYGTNWFISTVLLSAIGYFMGPASAPSIFAARSEETVRRNMILMPVYQVVVLLMLFAGFTAMLVTPGLKGPAADQSFMLTLAHFFPAWLLGIVAGAGCLAALLPASLLLLGASTVVSRNVIGNTNFVRPLILVCACLSLVLWLFAKTTLVDLLLFYYNGITQLAPGVILGVAWKRVNAWGIGAGIVAGELFAAYSLRAATGPFGINVGLISLAINVFVVTIVTLAFALAQRKTTAAREAA